MCGEGNPWICCGLPLEHAATVIGISDVLLGGLCTALFGWWVSQIYDEESEFYLHAQSSYTYTSHLTAQFPREVYVVLGVVSAFQVVMGVALTIGAMRRSTCICGFWMIISCLGAFGSWGFPIRIYEIWVVYRYYEELKNEQQVRQFSERQAQFPMGPPQRPRPKMIQRPQQQMWNGQVGPSPSPSPSDINMDAKFQVESGPPGAIAPPVY